MGEAADEAALFQGRDETVNARLGGQLQGGLHLVKRGRNPGFLDATMDEEQKLVLFARQQGDPLVRIPGFGLTPAGTNQE